MNIQTKIKIWKAKRLLKKIEGYERSIKRFKEYARKTTKWKKQYEKEYSKIANELSKEDFLNMAKSSGYL